MNGFVAIVAIFIGLPWLILHYTTKWKSGATLSGDDERLLDELHATARRLDDRMNTIERIMAADNPGWRQISADPADIGIEDSIITREQGRIK